MTTCVIVTFPEIGQEVSFHYTVLLWDLFPPLKMSCHGLENVNRTSITIGLSSKNILKLPVTVITTGLRCIGTWSRCVGYKISHALQFGLNYHFKD